MYPPKFFLKTNRGTSYTTLSSMTQEDIPLKKSESQKYFPKA
jgi:hypothetical protein